MKPYDSSSKRMCFIDVIKVERIKKQMTTKLSWDYRPSESKRFFFFYSRP